MNPIIQQAMTDALNYVDSCNAAAKDPLDNAKTPEVSAMERSELSSDDENRSQAKQTANETLDTGLKWLKEANQSALFLNFDDRFDNTSSQPQSVTLGSQKRFSTFSLSSLLLEH